MTEFALKRSGVCVCALATTLCDCIFVCAQNRYNAGFLYPYARSTQTERSLVLFFCCHLEFLKMF